MSVRMLAAERFWSKVDKTATCWLWRGHLNTKGYGKFWLAGREIPAQRYSWEVVHGAVPQGLLLDHLCRVRHCVNPEHLEPVTNRENILRGESPPALAARRSVCAHGHEYTPTNLFQSGSRRYCRTCHRATSRVYKARRRAASLVGLLVGLLMVVLVSGCTQPSSAGPRETPRVWELPSGEGVCVLLGDTPIGCYQKGTAP